MFQPGPNSSTDSLVTLNTLSEGDNSNNSTQHVEPGVINENGLPNGATQGNSSAWARVAHYINRWYPAMVGLGVCLNFAEWMAILYLVFRIHHDEELSYNLFTWFIFLIALASSSGLFWYLHKCTQQPGNQVHSNGHSRFLLRLSVILTEYLSLIFVFVYFECKAKPLYNSTIWTTTVEFRNEAQVPGVMVCGHYNDAISAQQNDQWRVCNFPQWSKNGSTNCEGYITEQLQTFTTRRYGSMECYNFGLSTETKFSLTSKELLVQTQVTC